MTSVSVGSVEALSTLTSSGSTIFNDSTWYSNVPFNVAKRILSFTRMFRRGRKNVSRCAATATLPGHPGTGEDGR
ncbi:MAG: hypothetical protein ABSB67_02575 [Bryobacteraceae bacterium]